MKYSSARAAFYKFIASSKRGLVYSSSIILSTSQHIFCIILALGSKFLYTLWPKPISLKVEFLSLAFYKIVQMLKFYSIIFYSIVKTAQFAPPWQGPHKDPIPAAMQAKGFANELPAILTVDVDAFCSWSAWQIHITQRALMIESAIQNSSDIGFENIIQRKFFMQPYYLFGWTTGSPIEVRYAQAAKVGILAIIFMASQCLSAVSLRSQLECKNAERAPTTPTIIAIGCAYDLNPLQNSTIFQFSIIQSIIATQNFANYDMDGNPPQRSRQQVSVYVECSANYYILQPRYISSPSSPFMQVIADMQLAVQVQPGSYVDKRVLLKRFLISKRQSPIVPLRTGISYYFPQQVKIAFYFQSQGYLGTTDVYFSADFYQLCFMLHWFV